MMSENWFLDNQDDFDIPYKYRSDEFYQFPNFEPDENGEFECAAIIVRDLIVFPRMMTPILIDAGLNYSAIQSALKKFETLVAIYVVDHENQPEESFDFLPIGTEISVGKIMSLPEGDYSALIQGRRRVEILAVVQEDPYIKVRVRVITEKVTNDRHIKALMRISKDLFIKCVHLDKSLSDEAQLFATNIQDPSWLTDMISSAITISPIDRRKLIIEVNPRERLKLLNRILAQELDVLELEDEIQAKIQNEVDKTQREYYLREQLKAIQAELGENDLFINELSELREKVKNKKLPDDAKFVVNKEIDRLLQMPPMSPETGIIRSYIDWILDLPWYEATDDNLDVQHANQVLEKNHYGLGKVKDRILEFIAVQKLKPQDSKQPILCFVGSPGTGKTSLGRSISEALGKKFVRVSLGGIRDEAEIRGHRRTYIGALPGRVLQTMKKAGTINPLFMLDEIDKLGSDFRGDPSAALLEVLDPEQNKEYSDHYLELDYDLSRVLFITTANTTLSIPSALLDRMEVIEFSSYIEDEKVMISKQFLIPRQLHETGIEDLNVQFPEGSIRQIIRNYTYEAGVRNLEREIGRICRKIARLKTEGKSFPTKIESHHIERFLGPQQIFDLEAEHEDEIGVATAMAWTESGGDIMPVEVLIVDGKGNLQITGQIGEVMQESAQAALSYMKSKADVLGVDAEIFENVDVHIHIPEGGIPKDGPSAGITIASALISAVTNRKVRRDVALTGEITLRGRILPVGGIREKILAAHRAGITKIFIPVKNEKDLVDLSKKVRKQLNIVLVKHMDEVIEEVLLPADPKIIKEKPARKPKEN
ncbi:MAG: endopeptidase La [Chloroflexi bacterium HGW-Chloroflexi-2]|jgi:ATP-dependent Lon protease|nr:MAG: endopeptidase La [Chloroflexi bacterium HGW-Chloroflexi-2]